METTTLNFFNVFKELHVHFSKETVNTSSEHISEIIALADVLGL